MILIIFTAFSKKPPRGYTTHKKPGYNRVKTFLGNLANNKKCQIFMKILIFSNLGCKLRIYYVELINIYVVPFLRLYTSQNRNMNTFGVRRRARFSSLYLYCVIFVVYIFTVCLTLINNEYHDDQALFQST